MSRKSQTSPDAHPNDKAFAEYASQPRIGFFREFLDFLLHSKKWWLAPIIVVLLVIGLLAVLSGTGAAPFIYTLF